MVEDDEVFRLSYLPSVWRVNVSVERNTVMETLSPENPIGNVTISSFCKNMKFLFLLFKQTTLHVHPIKQIITFMILVLDILFAPMEVAWNLNSLNHLKQVKNIMKNEKITYCNKLPNKIWTITHKN